MSSIACGGPQQPIRDVHGLLGTPAGVGDRQNEHPVAFTAGAFRAAPGMPDDALQQRAAQQLAGDRELADKLGAHLNGVERVDFYAGK